MQLTLVVNNTNDLDGGTKATFSFDRQGGVVGSDGNSDWVLADRAGTISGQHLRVAAIDGHFCAEVLTDAGISVNGSTTVVGRGETFRVSDGDILQLGRFEVSAYVTTPAGDANGGRGGQKWAERFVSVGTLVGDAPEDRLADGDLFEAGIMKKAANAELHERLAQATRTDPVSALEETRDSRSTSARDPVSVFDREVSVRGTDMTTTVDEYLNLVPEAASRAALPDDLQPGSTYFAPPRIQDAGRAPSGGPAAPPPSGADMDAYLESLAQSARTPGPAWAGEARNAFVRDSWTGAVPVSGDLEEEELVDHVVLRPLCAALGLPIQSMTVPQANRLARDVGDALKAAIAGIMDNHRRELSDKSHLAETHLHAIEDNPLRLDHSPEDAIQDLFLHQSPVHLSASAAIRESLDLLRHHQEASGIASEAALDAVLKALSPLALARRFKKYKGHAPRTGDLDAWHWTMYQHYYAEIRSDHQGGLSRMFWEVYRQVYDREMRRLTQEG